MGELLQPYAAAGRHGHLDDAGKRAVTTVLETITSRWMQPDAAAAPVKAVTQQLALDGYLCRYAPPTTDLSVRPKGRYSCAG